MSDEAIEEVTRRTRETVLPVVRKMDGYRGVFSLLDRHSGKALSVTLWEDEDAMMASEDAAHQTRAQAADIANELIEGVERFEVTFWEIS
jgi:heme-degrading monooxygenase HmoA